MVEKIEVELVPSKEMRGFAKQLSEEMSTGAGNATGGAKQAPKGFMGDLLGGVMKGLGIASGIGIIVQLLTSFKPLMTTISNIMKVIAGIISPIADVITMLLQPILVVLKPIMMVIRQLMAPFRKGAMDVLRQGAKARNEGDYATFYASIQVAQTMMLGGITAVITALSGEVMKMIINTVGALTKQLVTVITNVIAVVVGFFSDSAAESVRNFGENVNAGIDSITGLANNGVDVLTASIISGIATSVAVVGEMFGFNMEDFRKNVTETVNTVILKDPASILQKTQDAFIGLNEGVDIEGPFSSLRQRIQSEVDKIGSIKSRVQKARDYFHAANKYISDRPGATTAELIEVIDSENFMRGTKE